MIDLIIIGGGAAGIFAAIAAKEANKDASVVVLEKSLALLAKVRISGGGRCNVTHACFDPLELTKNYPRGAKELIAPFHRFSPNDTIAWFESRGVKLKAEADGRIFPFSDSSQSIIDCLLNEANRLGVEIRTRWRVESIRKVNDHFLINDELSCQRVLLATGSSANGHEWAKSLGHTIEQAIPSLFTFHSPTSPLKDLSGISMPDVEVRLKGFSKRIRGPILITHFGFSGPAIIKLSAWAAPFMFEHSYKAELIINWLPELSSHQIQETNVAHYFSKSLWRTLVDEKMTDQIIAEKLHADRYQIDGKTTFKKEFVTCGGINRKEVNFKTMESKICPGLFFAGEVLDIDGVTGGFNFQNAWTTAFIAANSLDLNLSAAL